MSSDLQEVFGTNTLGCIVVGIILMLFPERLWHWQQKITNVALWMNKNWGNILVLLSKPKTSRCAERQKEQSAHLNFKQHYHIVIRY